MLIDRYPPEDVFARVPELAHQTDPVLLQLDRLLDDDLYQHVRADLAQRYRVTPVHGRHSTPAEVLLRLLVASVTLLAGEERGTLNDRSVNGGVQVFAMCALDALGIPLMMGRGAVIVSQDPLGGEPVHEASMGGTGN